MRTSVITSPTTPKSYHFDSPDRATRNYSSQATPYSVHQRPHVHTGRGGGQGGTCVVVEMPSCSLSLTMYVVIGLYGSFSCRQWSMLTAHHHSSSGLLFLLALPADDCCMRGDEEHWNSNNLAPRRSVLARVVGARPDTRQGQRVWGGAFPQLSDPTPRGGAHLPHTVEPLVYGWQRVCSV